MGKIIKTIVVFVFTISVILVVAAIYLVKFSDTSFLGKIIKENVIRRPQLVRLFNLQKPGDGRFEYLSNANQKLNVDVYLLENIAVSDDLKEWIDDMILSTIERETNFSAHTLDEIEQKDEYTDDDLTQIIKLTSKDKKDNFLNIVYLPFYKRNPDFLGITINKNTIFIFKEGFQNINENEKVLRRLERSTIMHEWGHLLGLVHVEGEDCIMSEMVHFYSDRELWTGEVPTQYCAETLYEIMRMRK